MDNPVDESVDFNEKDSSPIYDVRDHSGFMPRPETETKTQIGENQVTTDNIGDNIADESGSCELPEEAAGNDDSDKTPMAGLRRPKRIVKKKNGGQCEHHRPDRPPAF